MVISPKRLHTKIKRGTESPYSVRPPRKKSYSRKHNNGLAFQPGMPVFIRDEKEVWIEGVVAVVTSKCLNIRLSSGKVRMCAVSDVLIRPQVDFTQVNNLTHLSPINAATVLTCLHKRYEQDILYTTAGTTVVAINPFKEVPPLYSRQTVYAYHDKLKTDPHIFVIAEEAHTRLVRQLGKVNQSIIVSGESGAGKTVSAKHLVRYMTIVSNPEFIHTQTDLNQSLTATTIESRILDSNPILEAFGNAATHRNSNSSRFGKYIHLQFERTGELQGASIRTYLLEKTRVVHQCDGESNFHIFYQMCNLTGQSTIQSGLQTLFGRIEDVDFKIVPAGQDVEENRDLQHTLEAMADIGLSSSKQRDVFQILIAILYLGNVEFSVVQEDISCAISDDVENPLDNTVVELEVSPEGLLETSNLLGVMPKHLEEAILHRKIEPGRANSRRTIFVKPVTAIEARSRKDCLAMLLYSRLFHWLVDFINIQIQADHFDNTIGLLDIYGFELFEDNSLEQLCINYANEKLQQHYVKHFLKDLQKEYEDEHISWVNIRFTDNEPCLAMLEGTGSVFGLLNEEVYLNRKCSNHILGERLVELSKKCKTHLKRPKIFASQPSFIVVHYAGDVCYSVNRLVTKNRDNVPVELLGLLQSSTNPFIVELFSDYQTEDAPGRKKKTVLSKFKGSLDCLMSCLNASDSHYIRCIKPNSSSEIGLFDRQYTMQQLQACGIIESVEICKRGYAARMPYDEFLHRYGILMNDSERMKEFPIVEEEVDSGMDEEEPLETICRLKMQEVVKNISTPKKKLRRRTGLSSIEHEMKFCAAIMRQIFGSSKEETSSLKDQFGLSKLFLHEYQLEELENIRLQRLIDSAAIIQRAWFCYKRKQKWQREMLAAFAIQAAWHGYKLRRRRVLKHCSAQVIQSAWHLYKCRREMKRKQHSARIIQTAWLYFQYRQKRRQKIEAARSIQRAWRFKRRRLEIMNKSMDEVDNRRDEENSQGKEESIIKSENKNEQFNTFNMIEKRIKQQTPNSPKLELGLEIRKLIALQNCTTSPTTHNNRQVGTWNETLRKNGFENNSFKMVNVVSPYKADDISQAPELDKDTVKPTNILLEAIFKVFPKLECLHFGDGIVSRRRLPMVPIKFHTRASVLKNAHFIHQKEFMCSLADCLPVC